MKNIILISVAVLFIFSSCEKTEDPGATSSVKMANEWWVTLDSVGIQDYYGIGPIKIASYNTSDNGNQMWIDDYQNGYGEKAKVNADYTNLTFQSDANTPNLYYDSTSPASYPQTVTITEGQIFPKMGHSKSGNIVDSIHMKIVFSDDPAFVYEMNGVERTRFVEDDY
jgi:hypothetical protein